MELVEPCIDGETIAFCATTLKTVRLYDTYLPDLFQPGAVTEKNPLATA
jgi:hypothetical protein